ncbi:MAG: carboxypeptidase-like regulatory domain-containing protein, partial [Armatimonadota bacterium]
MRTLTAVTLLALIAAPLCAEEVTITGRVLGPDGEAVEGAVVRVASDYYARVQVLFAETQSDVQGAFTLIFEDEADGEFYYVAAAKDGFVTGGDRLAPGEHVELRLSNRTTPVRGRVVDETGAPIEGAVVHPGNLAMGPVDGTMPTGHSLLQPTATTDAEGWFTLRGLPDTATFSLQVDADGFGGWRGSRANPITHEWRITMAPEAIITGHARADGEPIAGVTVSAQTFRDMPRGDGKAVTDVEGRYELRGLAASTYSLLVTGPDEWVAPAVQGVAVAAGQRVEGIDLALLRSTRVDVTVRHADTGAAVPEAWVSATNSARPDARPHSVRTRGDGHVTFFLPPGRTEIASVDAGGGELELVTPLLDVPPEMSGRTMEFVLRVRPRLLAEGVAVGPDGAPVAGAAIIIRNAEEPQTIADTDGRFRLTDTLEGLDFWAGRPAVVVSPDESLVGVFQCEPGSTNVVVPLTPAAEILVHIENEDGSPV